MPGLFVNHPSIRKGNRCSITVQDVTATGTILSAYGTSDKAQGGMMVEVRLDGTGQEVWAPLSILSEEQS